MDACLCSKRARNKFGASVAQQRQDEVLFGQSVGCYVRHLSRCHPLAAVGAIEQGILANNTLLHRIIQKLNGLM
jgi:hypothetical protein